VAQIWKVDGGIRWLPASIEIPVITQVNIRETEKRQNFVRIDLLQVKKSDGKCSEYSEIIIGKFLTNHRAGKSIFTCIIVLMFNINWILISSGTT
jgi:hypothetical protein